VCYHSFNLLISRSPPLRVYCQRLIRAFRTRFRFASIPKGFKLATDNNSQTHYAKGRRSQPCGCSHTLYAIGFRYYFTPLAGVLFTFPSRYLFTIGRQGVFSLIPWSGRIHAEFHLHRITWDSPRRFQTSLTRLSRSLADFSKSLSSPSTCHIEVPQPRGDKSPRFRLLRFRSPLLAESHSFSSPGVTEMFHFTPSRFSWTMNSSRDNPA
jgi:hypothetical protein